jgi:hypothetical protein
MRRRLFAAAALGAAGLVTGLALWSSASPADAGKADAAPALAKARPQLPVSQVVLFSSGVGYFQREGTIEGSARVDLTFPASEINDLLKSMVLQDLGGGQVDAVSYDSHDPIDKTLQSFAINLTSNPTLAQILNQARGEKVEVALQASATTQPGTLTGAVVGIEQQHQPAGKDGTLSVDVLNLWCAEGLRSVKLGDVLRIRFLNPVIDSEFRRALEVLTLSHDTQKKAVSLQFTGDGKRSVRVGYVVENPIWKTSYRLVLDKNGKPFLQGWAVVENPSDEDWKDVRMALVSGRPISFQMDLYQPLYVRRPTVEPELFASLRPPTYSGGMMVGMPGMPGPAMPPAPATFAAPARPTVEKPNVEMRQKAAGALGGRGAKKDDMFALGLHKAEDEGISLRSGVASAASAMQLGDYFQYSIDHPVNLARQKSALLPIVNKDIEGTKVSIFNEGTHPKFPLLGLRLKNTTGLHLMQGPITVFEGNSYAGDSRILDLQPKEERLLSYAIDLGTEVETHLDRAPEPVTAVKIYKGVLHTTRKITEHKVYNLKNRSEQDRVVLLEHPIRHQFKITSKQKPVETARDVYRFEVKLPAGQTAKEIITEEFDQVTQIALTNSDDQSVRYLLTLPVPSPKVREALEKALAYKTKLSATQMDLQQQERQLKTITDDQTRLRANLKEMPPTAAAYKRYLEKFDTQESEIERFQAQIKKLQEAEVQQRKEYENYLANLTLE